jgi:hypothetical protein
VDLFFLEKSPPSLSSCLSSFSNLLAIAMSGVELVQKESCKQDLSRNKRDLEVGKAYLSKVRVEGQPSTPGETVVECASGRPKRKEREFLFECLEIGK